MPALLASAPLAVVLIAMAALRWSAAAAGAAGLAVALGMALGPFDLAAKTGLAPAAAAAGVLGEAMHSTAVILWIILPALALYEFQSRSGAVARIRTALSGLTDDRRLQAVLIAWFFGLFMEGAAGFGTPVALAAPLLVSIGFAPVRAVVLALIGHAAGVSFGAVGTPTLVQAEITGLPVGAIAAATATLHAALGGGLLVLLVRIADEGPLRLRDLSWTALAAALVLVPYLALAVLAGPELPALGGGLVGMAAFVLLLRRRRADPGGDLRGIGPDLVPYLIIVALVLATRLVAPLREVSGGLTIDWAWSDVFGGSFQPVYHPGTLLFAGFAFGAFVTGRARHLAPAVASAARRMAPVALALFLMLTLSRIMVHSGMIDALAMAAARTGSAWPLLAPWVGVLGTFVTGSATASNILFTEFQMTTAASLSLPLVAMVAGQGFGAAIGNVVAPYNIIAGSATVGLSGREGDILARTAPACALYAAAGGALLLAYASLASVAAPLRPMEKCAPAQALIAEEL
jgi:lactate permease